MAKTIFYYSPSALTGFELLPILRHCEAQSAEAINNVKSKTTFETAKSPRALESDLLKAVTIDDIGEIVAWLNTQDNHFGRSAVEALYKQLIADNPELEITPQAGLSEMNTLLLELIFIDIVTGVITKDSQGQLLISMHAIKKAAKKYGLDLYGTKYDVDTFLAKFGEITGYSAVVQYNGYHFLNVTGVFSTEGVITHVQVTNGYINGIEQTKTIDIDEFKANYEGKLARCKNYIQPPEVIKKPFLKASGLSFYTAGYLANPK